TQLFDDALQQQSRHLAVVGNQHSHVDLLLSRARRVRSRAAPTASTRTTVSADRVNNSERSRRAQAVRSSAAPSALASPFSVWAARVRLFASSAATAARSSASRRGAFRSKASSTAPRRAAGSLASAVVSRAWTAGATLPAARSGGLTAAAAGDPAETQRPRTLASACIPNGLVT